ncbi:MAG: DUF423 domain-containing protein [Chromatiales bacterium]|nr:DUF423 domain-containing protein [Chromatiales bacterium]
MNPGARIFLVTGALAMGFAVLAGAFGAHALASRLEPALLAVWRTAAEYQFYHAIGLLIVGLLRERFPTVRAFAWAGWLMLLGIVLFSGSLYGLSAGGLSLGIVTPLGGLSFLLSWICVVLGTLRAGCG